MLACVWQKACCLVKLPQLNNEVVMQRLTSAQLLGMLDVSPIESTATNPPTAISKKRSRELFENDNFKPNIEHCESKKELRKRKNREYSAKNRANKKLKIEQLEQTTQDQAAIID